MHVTSGSLDPPGYHETNNSKEKMMSSEDNKSLNLRWIEAFNEQDWETEAACRSADYLAHMSGAPGPLDAASWAGFMQAFTTAFPDAHITVDDDISEGNIVASRWTITGTHRG